ncbi:MAG: GNAT family N-acetyltransferase [Microbacterium sp.]
MSAADVIRNAPDQSRYEYVADGEVIAVAEYQSGPGYVVMNHTHTEPAHRGHGVAARLVAGALDDLRRRDLRVIASCWYVAQYVDEHPEYQDILHAHSKPGSAGMVG